MGYYTLRVNNFVPPFRQNVLSPSDGWLSLVQMAAEVTRRRKRCQLYCRSPRMVSNPSFREERVWLHSYKIPTHSTHTFLPTVALHPLETISFTLSVNQACSSETSEQPCHLSVCYNSEDYNFNNSCSEVLNLVIILDGIFKGIRYLLIPKHRQCAVRTQLSTSLGE